MAAIAQNGAAIRYAAESLKRDVISAVAQDG